VNKPSVIIVAVILWITALAAYLVLNRYQVRYDKDERVTMILDKWTGKVQALQGNGKNDALKEPDQPYPQKNDAKNSVNEKEPRSMPELEGSIQNKEP
jgi:hypothetical protein